jgi:hypothetical protein
MVICAAAHAAILGDGAMARGCGSHPAHHQIPIPLGFRIDGDAMRRLAAELGGLGWDTNHMVRCGAVLA